MTRILFIDRDGTLIEEPPDFQVDALDKVRFVPGMLPALLTLRDAGFEFVMVSNQDGLGTASFPTETFHAPHALLMQLLESQGIRFREVLIDPSLPEQNDPNRKPGLGMVMHYLRDRSIDLAGSAVIGDRETDLQFARNLGVRGFRIGPGHLDWAQIAHTLANAPRAAAVERKTSETRIRVMIDLDRRAEPVIATGHGFFDHMLEQIGKHGGFALDVQCAGDLHIDEHHTVEDTALAIGQALRQALGNKRGIGRYGFADADGDSDVDGSGSNPAGARAADSSDTADPERVNLADLAPPARGFVLPMDEAIARAALDISGRAYFVFDGQFPRSEVGGLATELVPHFFRSLCDAAGLNLHLSVRGENTHHMVEGCFKAVARALRIATRREGSDLPSTKGVL
jgi:imidazoleglycerol-phosphate dehydratase / histidinol-phosphatase